MCNVPVMEVRTFDLPAINRLHVGVLCSDWTMLVEKEKQDIFHEPCLGLDKKEDMGSKVSLMDSCHESVNLGYSQDGEYAVVMYKVPDGATGYNFGIVGGVARFRAKVGNKIYGKDSKPLNVQTKNVKHEKRGNHYRATFYTGGENLSSRFD